MSVININVKKTLVPLIIGGLEFALDLSDEMIKTYEKKAKEVEEIAKTIDQSNFEEVKKMQAMTIDFFLGEGAYAKLYEKYPSTMALADVSKAVVLEFAKATKEYTQVNEDFNKEFAKTIAKKAKK